LKSRTLLALVQSLGEHPSGREAIAAAGVADTELPVYEAALQTLACTGMIRCREV
jgi:putative mycofactocin binding protein MftB